MPKRKGRKNKRKLADMDLYEGNTLRKNPHHNNKVMKSWKKKQKKDSINYGK
tara:strand:+ start:347 stop:502 length:156 start_codon:yes stop_codon:yes gene_type:complete